MCLVPLREQLVKRGFDVTVTGQISSITLRSDYNKCLNVLRGTTTDQLYAQSGKHIKTSWVDGSGLQFNPDGVLVSDVTDLPVNAGANLKANPIVGYVVNTSSVGLSG